MLTSKMLQNTEMVGNVWVAGSASQALDQMKAQTDAGQALPEMVFLDIRMPDMDGWQFMDALTTTFSHHPKPEIVLLTGSTRTKDLIKSVIDPTVGILINKPLTDFELRQVLRDFMNRRMNTGNGGNAALSG